LADAARGATAHLEVDEADAAVLDVNAQLVHVQLALLHEVLSYRSTQDVAVQAPQRQVGEPIPQRREGRPNRLHPAESFS
jgi:hypothetical protein